MAQGKYEKYVMREAWRPTVHKEQASLGTMTPVMILLDKYLLKEAAYHVEVHYMTQAGAGFGLGANWEGSLSGHVVKPKPHKHPYDEFFCFIGTDPHNTTELGAEGEVWLGEGEKAEKYTFNTPTCVYIPKGLMHLPIYFRKVDRPIVAIITDIAPESLSLYTDKMPPGFSMNKP